MPVTMATCEVCKENQHKYKCPNCLTKYCSVHCFKTHKERKCEKPETPTESSSPDVTSRASTSRHTVVPNASEEDTEDRVSVELLKKLGESVALKEMLDNGHLRQILLNLDSADRPDIDMEKAMHEPIFLEFADECLKIVEPQNES